MAPLSSSHVTAHFTRAEMRYDSAPAHLRPALEALARYLETLRLVTGPYPAGGGMSVSSTWRSPTVNATTVGAAENSQHLTATAADFKVLGITVETWLERLARSGFLAGAPEIIVYPLGNQHVHAGMPRPLVPHAPNVVLVQTSAVAAKPVYRPVLPADSAAVYAELRRRRNGAVSVLVLVVLAVLAVLFTFNAP